LLAVEVNGRWRQAIEVPGLGALNNGGNAGVSSVSCASAGSCAAAEQMKAGAAAIDQLLQRDDQLSR
jgi:hypothetical protein